MSAVKNEDTKRRIFDAALSCFAKQDFHVVTMDQIASEAGVAKGTMYLYFKTKENLFVSLITDGMKDLSLKVDTIAAGGGTAVSRLEKIADIMLEHFARHADFFRIAVHGARMHPSVKMTQEFHKLIRAEAVNGHMKPEDFFRGLTMSLARVIDDGMEKTEFKRNDPHFVAFIFLGMIKNALMSEILITSPAMKKLSPEKRIEIMMNLFLTGILKEKGA